MPQLQLLLHGRPHRLRGAGPARLLLITPLAGTGDFSAQINAAGR